MTHENLRVLRDLVHAEALTAGRADLADLVAGVEVEHAERPVRVVVVGETKRGKSTLVNTLVGRPLLSPVGVDVTTACWLELTYGEHDEAIALVADPETPGAPSRVPVDVREVERYVALSEVVEPVLGVEVRLRAPLLRDLVLVDTPGVGGLYAGHTRTTLSALARADALLFVCDANQPILRPEVQFLVEAANRVPTVVVAVTKCDTKPDFADVVEETRARIAERPRLRGVPVHPVAAPLADRAAEQDNAAFAARLQELSGMTALVSALRQRAVLGAARLHGAGHARLLSTAARELARQARESDEQVTDRLDQVASLRADQPRLTALTQRSVARLRTEPLDAFRGRAQAIRGRFRTEAERGPAAQLPTLAPRLVADLTALGVTVLEDAAHQGERLVRKLLDQVGAGEAIGELPVARSWRPNIGDAPDDSPNRTDAVTSSVTLFSTVVECLAGAAAVVTVLTGPGVLAASIALAACAGWWHLRGGSEQQRRAQLRAWVDTAVDEATAGFERELGSRVNVVTDYLDAVLPEVLALREKELSASLRRDTSTARARVAVLDGLAARCDGLVAAYLGTGGRS